MQRSPWLPVVLFAAINVSGCEGKTVQQSVSPTIETLTVNKTALAEQPNLAGLNKHTVNTA